MLSTFRPEGGCHSVRTSVGRRLGAGDVLTETHRSKWQKSFLTNSDGKSWAMGGRPRLLGAPVTTSFFCVLVAFFEEGRYGATLTELTMLPKGDPKNPGGEKIASTGFVIRRRRPERPNVEGGSTMARRLDDFDQPTSESVDRSVV